MNTVEHSVYNYDPALYRMIHVGSPGDAEFYRAKCEGAGSVLELGCGWGRISRHVVAVVDRFVGLDINEAMIEAAQREVDEALADDVEFVVGDMRDFDFEERFDRIIIPYNSLYNLLSSDEVTACLTAVRRHLDDDGVLLFDGYHVDPQMLRAMEQEGGVDRDLIGVFEEDGQSIEVIEKSTYDVPRRRFDATYVYRFHREDGTSEAVECRIPQRFLLPFELEDVLERAGLKLESVTGDFFDEPLEPFHAQMVVTATR